jgi:outer membrane protein assembly factor BamB
MKKTILLLPLLLLTVIICAQSLTQWRGENRDGFYNETGLLKKWPDAGPKLLWHYDLLGDGHASAAVNNNRIFTSGMIDTSGYVFAFDMDGKLLWKTEYGPEWTASWPGVRTTPVISEEIGRAHV